MVHAIRASTVPRWPLIDPIANKKKRCATTYTHPPGPRPPRTNSHYSTVDERGSAMSKATPVHSDATIPRPSEVRQRRDLITSFATSCSAVLAPTELHSTTRENGPHLERKQLQLIWSSSIHISQKCHGADPTVSRDRPQGLSLDTFSSYFKTSETFTLLRTLEYVVFPYSQSYEQVLV